MENDSDIDVNIQDLGHILDEDEGAAVFDLPEHIRCVAHCLSLIASQDPKKITESRFIRRSRYNFYMKCLLDIFLYVIFYFSRTCGKIRKLWTRQAKSPKAAELICSILGRHLVVPGDTRWNAFYDGISCILKFSPELLSKVMTELKIGAVDETDIEFLREMKLVSTNDKIICN
jgi:hypothetical protein